MIWPARIQAGALQLVTFIGAIIAVLLLCFVMLAHVHDLFDQKTDKMILLWQGSEDVMKHAFSMQMESGDFHELENKVIGIPDTEIEGRRSFWGLYETYELHLKSSNQQVVRKALVGRHSEKVPALYLQDKQRPLVIAGDAEIRGDAFLSTAGIRPGSISGNGYRGDKLVFGTIRQSQIIFPSPETDRLQAIHQLLNLDFDRDTEMQPYVSGLQLKRSFHEPTLLIEGDILILSESQLIGNVIVSAAERIIVEASTELRDVILVAPQIVIKDHVQGRFQALASRQILMGKNCRLEYPSALWVQPGTPNVDELEQTLLSMDSFSQLQGIAGTWLQEDQHPFRPEIKINEEAEVIGEVLCAGNLELKGRVHGSVMAAGFLALENGSIYQNHLYNGTIDTTGVTGIYAGMLPMEKNVQKSVITWLY